jgi:hypothetical protein
MANNTYDAIEVGSGIMLRTFTKFDERRGGKPWSLRYRQL